VAIAAATLYWWPKQPPLAIRSIAVLPFANAEKGTEYLSDGLAEGLIEDLSQSPHLRVKSRTASFRFKGKPAEPRAIGKDLNVAALVTGNLQRDHLYLELIDSRDGAQLWSKDYPVHLATLGALSRQLAADLSFRLGATMADEAASARKMSPAYDLYLRGRFLLDRRGCNNMLRVRTYFERATQLDPNFALAWAGLGSAYGLYVGNGCMPGSEAMLMEKEMASRAASETTYFWGFAAAERDFRRAIELNPSYAPAHEWYGAHLMRLSRFVESTREVNLAYQLEPFSAPVTSYVCWNLLVQGQYDEAIAFSQRTGEIDWRLVNLSCLASSQLMKGQYEEAITTIRRSSPANADQLADAFRRGGREGYWKKRLELQRNSPVGQAVAYAALGDHDRAFAALDAAFHAHSFGMADFYTNPFLDNLRSDPRFDELARKIGLPQVARK